MIYDISIRAFQKKNKKILIGKFLFFQNSIIFAPLLKKSTVFNKIQHRMRVWRNW